jgi:hypothetical protein
MSMQSGVGDGVKGLSRGGSVIRPLVGFRVGGGVGVRCGNVMVGALVGLGVGESVSSTRASCVGLGVGGADG